MIWKTVIILGYFVATIIATPIGIKNMQIMNDEEEQEQEEEQQIPTLNQRRTEMALSTLNLPSNATSIRADITDGFSCEDLSYGYYADIENDCQIFHVCLPVVYPDGKENTFRWSFICPEETVFSQDSFTCMRSEDVSFGCEESAKYYDLNRNFGMILDTSSEMNNNNNNNDLDMTSNHMMKEKSELIQENIDNDVIVEKLKLSIINNDNQQQINYIPTISTTLKPVTVKPVTVKPVTVKLDSNKKRRKNPNRKSQPIRKTTSTTASIPNTTTFKTIEQEPEIIEKTTMKYQRFTRRPDINKDNNNKKKIDTLHKVTTQNQKRKRPSVSLNLNSKKNDMNIQKDEKPVTEINTILPLPTVTVIPEITIEKETFKPIIVKNDEPIIEPLIVDIKEEEEILQTTTVITKYVETIPATEKPLISDEIIPNMPEEEQQIAENNRITPLPNLLQQFIKDDEEEKKESMTQTDDGNIKDNINNDNDEQKTQNNHDQQSMIINLISSLVNAENTKVDGEEEKFDNMNVQNSQNNNNNEKNNDEQLNIMSELMTTKIPEVQETVKDENLNSEHVIVNIEDKLKNDDDEDMKNTAEHYNIHKYQSNMYNHMTHIPVRIISDDTLPIELIEHNVDHAEQWNEVQQTDNEKHDKLESLNTDDKKLVMDKLEDILLEAIKMSEEGSTVIKEIQDLTEEQKLNDELKVKNEENLDTKENIIENNEVTVVNQSSEEVQPIYHRIIDEPANLLKPEILSVLVDEQPIIHNLDEDVKMVQEIESENKIPELILPNLNEESKLQEVIDSSSSDSEQINNIPVNNIPEIITELTLVDKQPINENSLQSLTITEAQIPLESIPLNSNNEEQNLQITEIISSSTAEPIITDIVSDRTNEARSLKKKMDPRKRRFLFRSDAK